ncbi:YicC/YloC family endoribonuclease [Shimia aestuarii]|uniref:TIGR00255 family protein n=1 Tax=Shimia aestuarii TaxID=254406 RepID=A0A1I4NZK8_9RHOB|nr:YicC/YloC family endoribonuclease [Shimia aestuarii]SFM20962.1 TIGR00255 family protein [Shimia aestuarii]
MLQSMTGFAALKGSLGAHSWTWDIRSVNAKGLDLRLRMPDWIEGLEPAVRGALGKSMSRGSVSLGLRVQREESEGTLTLNRAQLSNVLAALHEAETLAAEQGIALSASRSADILNVRGVLETATDQDDSNPLREALMAQLPDLIEAFLDMRRAEGTALETVLRTQLDEIERLTADATVAAEARRAETAEALRANLARVLENADGVDEARVAQELAMIAVKADVTEELDRLRAHVDAARDLLSKGSPVGRKLDFLMQEFNREANTLCSKAQSVALTRIGLDLKTVIDQMREQVQNVE